MIGDAAGFDLLVRRRLDVRRELAQRLRDRGLDVLRRGVDVAVERELQRDLTSSRAADVDVMLSMPAIVENCFSSGVATDGGHRLRARARQARVDLDGRIVDGRQIADRQRPVRDDAEHDDARP